MQQISDDSELESVIDGVLSAHADSVSDYKSGKTNALMFLVGQTMKATRGKANPKIVNEILRKKLSA